MLANTYFTPNQPWSDTSGALGEFRIDDQIDGVRLQTLTPHEDARGHLTVLFSERHDEARPHPPHVYLVTAEPRSIRAWVYHERQEDRLAWTNGAFVVALYDIRPDSPTYRTLNVLHLGEARKTLLTIPRYVVHGVYNQGAEAAFFVNMPTRAYDPARPDKMRLAYPHDSVPFVFA